MWRTIFIWDVHWCYKELKLLIKRLKIQEGDKVYLTGDLINGWPKNYKVLKFLYKNRNNFKAVLWNNDLGFLRWCESWTKKFAGKCFQNYSIKNFKKLRDKIKEKDTEYILGYLKSLPLYIEKENFILVHGWIIPWKKLKEHTEAELMCTRKYDWIPWYDHYEWKKKVIYGHWAKNGLRVRKNTVWLDTGCVYWKWLTAYVLETGEIYSQTSKDLYINLYKKKNENKELEKQENSDSGVC